MTVKVLEGDCMDHMAWMDDNVIDAIVTDPPYGLSFMGKDWDHGVPGLPFWQECLRVSKPGAHMLAFGGTRTHHRLMVAIEDAGWEIRDTLGWIYGQGFPKGQDIAWILHQKACIECGYMDEYDHQDTREEAGFIPKIEHHMRFVRATYLQTPVYACSKCGQVLQPFLPKQSIQEHRTAWSQSQVVWPEQPIVERGCDLETSERKLQGCSVCQMSHRIFADGAEGRVCNDSQVGDGAIPWQIANEDGGCPSYRPQSIEQLNNQPNAFSIERAAQTRRGFNVALKPAWEPIILCRKPLEGTVANSVQKWGVGGINIDGCRVGTEQLSAHGGGINEDRKYGMGKGIPAIAAGSNPHIGRFPANLIHDSSDEVLALFPDTKSGNSIGKALEGVTTNGVIPQLTRGHLTPRFDNGSAARFFYCAKASKSERNLNCETLADKTAGECTDRQEDTLGLNGPRAGAGRTNGAKNFHPTVKPQALLRYLCKLITPKNGTILDPFAGSGSTGVAASAEGFDSILIELEKDYAEIARVRNA